MLYQSLSDFILLFDTDIFIILLLVFGYYRIDKVAFLNTTVLILFSGIINLYLKYLWMIPLNPEIGKFGWTYPSGHATVYVILWCSLAMQLRNKWIYTITLLALPLISMATVVKRYHVFSDIVAGACISILMLTIFYPLLKTGKLFNRPVLIFITLLSSSLLFLHPTINVLLIHHFQSLGFFLALTLVQPTDLKPYSLSYSILYTVLFVIQVVMLFQVISFIGVNLVSKSVYGFGIVLILLYTPKMGEKLKNRLL